MSNFQPNKIIREKKKQILREKKSDGVLGGFKQGEPAMEERFVLVVKQHRKHL